MSDRKTWKVQPFLPDNPPKYLVIWTEDLLLTVEANAEKRGYIVGKRQITVFYDPGLPIGLFHLTMTHVVAHISYVLGLEARYDAPTEDGLYKPKPQPWTFGGCDLIAPNMVGDPEDFLAEESVDDDSEDD